MSYTSWILLGLLGSFPGHTYYPHSQATPTSLIANPHLLPSLPGHTH